MTAASGDLADAPEERQRPLDHAAHVLAPGLVAEEEAGRRVNHVVEGGLVEPPYRGFLLVQGLGLIPSRHLRFDLRHVRPAEPRLVAAGAHPDGDRRIGAVGAGMPGMEHLPAALAGRRFHGAAGRGPGPTGWRRSARYS